MVKIKCTGCGHAWTVEREPGRPPRCPKCDNIVFRRTSYVLACPSCGFRDYRLDRLVEPLRRLKYISEHAGRHPSDVLPTCRKCGGRVAPAELRKGQASALRRKFPNKRAIHTKKTVDELLKMPGDTTPGPEV